MKQFSIDDVLELHPCGHKGPDDGKNYCRARIERLFADRDTINILDVVDMVDVLPKDDIIWLFCKHEISTRRALVVFACKCAEDAGLSAQEASAAQAASATSAARATSAAQEASAASATWAARAARAAQEARAAWEEARERQLLFICETICEEEGYEI